MAAHCFFDEENNLYEATQLKVTLGKHDRLKTSDEETSRQELWVLNLLVHPGYNHSSQLFEDDIALLLVGENEININDYVRLICLWNDDYHLDKIVNKTGIVVGWGFTAEHKQATILQKAELPVTSYENCYNSGMRFYQKYMHPTENFCAGVPQEQRSACIGDSGGGFFFYDKYVDRYFVRGVVSLSKLKNVIDDDGYLLNSCNPAAYALYTDVTSYMQWIVDNTPDINKYFI
ncbi:serine protease gd-like [Neocloeon triangulifer]|uniref:serine protease gd-like n=1 Tax=Neocloeon triangulifer TaxID=2078957 RepID=UPI00286F396F|nr:serine protease gd-like [Neocloeon triangulifer]